MELKLKRKVKESKTIHFNDRYILFIPKKIYTIDNETLSNHLLSTDDFEEHIIKPKKKKSKSLKIKPIKGIKEGTEIIKEITLKKTIKRSER